MLGHGFPDVDKYLQIQQQLVESNQEAQPLSEMDERMRSLHRRASVSGSHEDRAALALAHIRSGDHKSADRALGDDNPHRKELITRLSEGGNHEGAKHLRIGPHMRAWQNAKPDSKARQQAKGEVYHELKDHAESMGKKNAWGHAADNLHDAHRYLSRDHAPDPKGSHEGAGLTDHVAHWHGFSGSGGDYHLKQMDSYSSGDDKHWNTKEVSGFKKGLDHHKLGKVSRHSLADVRTYGPAGDFHPPLDEHGAYSVSAYHNITVDPRASKHAEVDHHRTPHDYADRDTRRVGWANHYAQQKSADKK